MQPYLIGVAGASCSGKTTFAKALGVHLGRDATVQITLDSYYYDLSHLTEDLIGRWNLDEPAALEHELLFDNLERLSRGETIQKPVYDHRTHTRRARPAPIKPKPYVIIEGLFALYWEEVRKLLGTKVFIDATHDLCLERRYERDRSKRGRTQEEVTRRYNDTVGPMYDLHVYPTRRHAEVIVSATDPVAGAVSAIMKHIRS